MPHDKSGGVGNRVDVGLIRHGGLSYLEIPALNVDRSALFYQRVLGWEVGGADRSKFSDGKGLLIGRWLTDRPIGREPGLLPFFYVERVEEAVLRARECEGEIVRAPYPEGNLLVSLVRDPAGNLIGLWQDSSL
jgi:uncharacterized protein